MNSSNHDRFKLKSILLTIILAAASRAGACGLGFPNNLLTGGDEAVLAAPTADFFREMKNMRLPRTRFQAHESDDFAAEAADADKIDLGNALKETKLSEKKRNAVLQNFENERAKLTDLRIRLDKWNPTDEGAPRPMAQSVDTSALVDVPDEFVDYLQGSLAWFGGDTNGARAFWESLIHRRAAERHYRSTWAAYMLGKSWLADDPETAAGYFEQVRLLKLRGFSDRIGLAAASLGEEGRARLRQKKFDEAIALYTEQLATGEKSAAFSLRFACRDALAGDDDLTDLATNSQTRRVMSAFIISQGGHEYCFDQTIETNRLRWLQAVEAADIHDIESAEQLALAAYQAGLWDTAQRWIQRAPETPTAQWLQAKLLLRGGKVRPAAVILNRIAELFPTEKPDTEERPAGGLETALSMNDSEHDRSARDQIEGESGVLHLARREYTESLDALLRGGFWPEAAYVAERVLTAPELKSYVDQNWPAKTESETNGPDPMPYRAEIRHLLARRLARAGDFDAARSYYPPTLLGAYDEMVNNIDLATGAESPRAQKIQAFTNAAAIFYSNGMELLGTEVWPDWRAWEFDPLDNRRPTNSILVTASDDEIQRTYDGLDPSLKYHYRYQAARLEWEAAQLMPNNTEDKARALCAGGSWIKYLNPKAADDFYKALVHQCRKTALGELADRMRWFPKLAENGNPLPWRPAAPIETNGPAEASGLWYALNRGNTLQDVADAARQGHNVETTVALLQEANPSLNVNRLKAGLRVCVPAPSP